MNLENSLWYKTIELRGLLVVWFCSGFAPHLSYTWPLEFDEGLSLVFTLLIAAIAIRATFEAVQAKSLIKLILYGMVPLIIFGASYAYK